MPGKNMVKKSETWAKIVRLFVRANWLRYFTAVTCSLIAGVVTIILHLASTWEEKQRKQDAVMQQHTEALEKILLVDQKISDKIDNEELRIDDNKAGVTFAVNGLQDVKIEIAKIEAKAGK